MKNALLFTYNTNILVRLLILNINKKTVLPQKSENVQHHPSNAIENATRPVVEIWPRPAALPH